MGYIVTTPEEFANITAAQSNGTAEYNKVYQIEEYTGVLDDGFGGYVFLSVRSGR